MTAGTYNITIEQGADWQRILTYKSGGAAVNLAGYSARMQIRHVASSPTVLAWFAIASSSSSSESSGSPAFALGTIALGGSAGTITLDMPASQASMLPAGSHVYDLELISPVGRVTRILEGNCEVVPEVTR
jgi:hypothetical protein